MMMRRLRGTSVVPVVELRAKPMKTQFGTKQRPFFKIVDWRDLSVDDAKAAHAPSLIGAPIKQIATKEEFDDEIPTFDAG